MSSNNSPVLVLEPRPRWLFRQPASRRVTRVTWRQDGRWQVDLADGQSTEATLGADSWLHPWLMSLRWRLSTGGRCRAVFCRWHYSHRQWHAWRLRLRQQGRTELNDAVPR